MFPPLQQEKITLAPESAPPRKRARPDNWFWLVLGGAVLTLSYAWLFGVVGRTGAPPALLRCQLYPLLFALHFGMVVLVCRRHEPPSGQRRSLAVVLVWAMALRLVVLAGSAPKNGDVDRYLWEGLVLLEGHNPYAAPPSAPEYNELRARLQATGDRLYSGKWTTYAGIRTVYGPVATALFAVPHLLPFDRVRTWRVLMTVFDLATVLVLIALASVVGQGPEMAVVYAWSPVCLDAFANRGQVDAVMVFFVMLASLLAVQERPTAAGAAFAAALLTKISPLLLLLPLLRVGKLRFAATFAAVLVLGLLPFAGAGLAGLSGFRAFAEQWQTCDSVFSLTRVLLTPLAGVLDPGRTARALLGLAAIAYAVAGARKSGPADARWLVDRAASISAAVILLSPVTFPWYPATLLAFASLCPRASFLALAAAPMFWYLRFLTAPQASPWHWVEEVGKRWTEPWRLPVYSAVFILFARDLRRANAKAPPPPLETAGPLVRK